MRPQHMEALAEANRVRLSRGEFKRQLRRGDANLADTLRDLPDWLDSEPVGRLLRALPHVGTGRAEKLVTRAAGLPGPGKFHAPFNVEKAVGDLTPRQRGVLADVLEREYYRSRNGRH